MNPQLSKRIALIAICLAGIAPSAFSDETPASRPQITVKLENDLESLAAGYSKAFLELGPGLKYVVVKSQKGQAYLEGSVRTVRAAGAVLILTMSKGSTHAISAGDIAKLTTTPPDKGTPSL